MQLHDVNWVDYGILTLIGVSVLMGIFRGFVREAMSLVTWLTAIALGIIYYEPVSAWFVQISMVGLRLLVSFVLIVLAVLIAGGILSHLIFRLIKFTGFGVTDRIIGVLFGLGRGAIAVALSIMIFLPTPLAKDRLWQESTLIPRFVPLSGWLKERVSPLSDWAKDWIPEEFFKKFNYLDS